MSESLDIRANSLKDKKDVVLSILMEMKNIVIDQKLESTNELVNLTENSLDWQMKDIELDGLDQELRYLADAIESLKKFH